MPEKKTAKAAILDALSCAKGPVAVHELSHFLVGISQNSIATRLSELHADGKVVRRTRLGEAFCEWRLATIIEQEKILKARSTTTKLSVPLGKVVGVKPELGLEQDQTGEIVLVTLEIPRSEWNRAEQMKAVRIA